MKVRALVVLVLAGLKVAVTPLGTPVAERFTSPPRLTGLTIPIVVAPVPFTSRVIALADEERLKLGASMESENDTEVLAVPETPVMVPI